MVNPSPASSAAFQSDANELGSSGFASFVGGLQFQVGRFMAFGQYQVTTGSSQKAVTASDGTVLAVGRLLEGPTHTFSGGLRIGLGSSRESGTNGGY